MVEILLRFTHEKWCFGAAFRDGALVAAAQAYARIVGARDLRDALQWARANSQWQVHQVAVT